MQLKKALTAIAIAAGALFGAPAQASVTSEGVTYSASWTDLAGDLWQLTIGIDAAANTFSASALETVSIVPGGSWSGVSLFSKTNGGTIGDDGIFAGPSGNGGGDGCKDNNASAFCVQGSASVANPITLVFQFTDPDGGQSPHVQVAWNVGGHHFSEEVPPTAVPEPETYALMLAGLTAVGFLARRRKSV